MLGFSVVIGIVFGFVAALMAFVITWREFERHKFAGERLFKEAFQSGIFTFVVFLLLSILAGFLLIRFVVHSPMFIP
ncbi:MAG: hypothetical protein COX96_04960 [Candidatus Omnitrophica bacterium CG_4_10_14_0_2_um_filter_44_9]|nr:MAG: hypothetical protein COY78_05780 [Candidatus Omnitrophica bacterium CG_4_10_14_0_8_um_filter_44_12]PIZ84217.1 MAG: hypothetical protein COX96_04960 [Candidatus Omnitrophica bacterium CG_4_10_14_0_2_um_filter_44_9]